MVKKEFIISEIQPEDKSLISNFISENWESTKSVSKGKIHDVTILNGFICKKDNQIIGLITVDICGKDCEIVTLDSKVQNSGLGTKLINQVIERVKLKGCKRVWLITTNDNINAIRFYQNRGFEWVGFYKDSMQKSRQLKPEIPETGFDDIPIKHEVEFEYKLD